MRPLSLLIIKNTHTLSAQQVKKQLLYCVLFSLCLYLWVCEWECTHIYSPQCTVQCGVVYVEVCQCVLSLERHPASSRVRGADRRPQGHSSLWSVILSGDTRTLQGNILLLFRSLPPSGFCSLHLCTPLLLSSVPLKMSSPLFSVLLSFILLYSSCTFTPSPLLLSNSLYNFSLIVLSSVSLLLKPSLPASLFPSSLLLIRDLPPY